MKFKRIDENKVLDFLKKFEKRGCGFLAYIYWRSTRKRKLKYENELWSIYVNDELICEAEKTGIIKRNQKGIFVNTKELKKIVDKYLHWSELNNRGTTFGVSRPPLYVIPKFLTNGIRVFTSI